MTIWANTRKLFTPQQIETARVRIREKFPTVNEFDVEYMTSAWLERQICKTCDGTKPCPLTTEYFRAAYIGVTVYGEKEVRLQRCGYKRCNNADGRQPERHDICGRRRRDSAERQS